MARSSDFPGGRSTGASVSAHKSATPLGAMGQLDLRQALIIIRSHLVIGVAIALVVCTFLGWQQMRRPRLYMAQVTFTTERREQVIDLNRWSDSGRGEGLMAETRSNQLRGAEVANYVIKSLTPAEREQVLKPYLTSRPSGDEERRLTGILMGSVSVSHDPEEINTLRLTVTHRDPEAAALIANRYADQFIRFLYDKSSQSSDAGLAFLRDQAEDLRKKLETSERSLQEYRSRYNLVSLDESQNIVVDRLKALNTHATAARVRRAEIEVRLNQAETAQAERRDPVELATLADSPALSDVQKSIDDLAAKRAVFAERYGPRHPQMQEITRTLEALEKLRGEQIVTALTNLKNQRDKAVSEEKELNSQLAEAEAAALRLDQLGIEYGVLRRSLETQKTIYSDVLSRLNEASITAQLESVNTHIVERAQVDDTPISPNLRKTSLLLTAFFFLITLGYPFCVELLFARVRSATDVEYYLGATLLGEIGSVQTLAEKDRPHLVRSGSEEPVAEQFRAFFSQYQLVSKIDPPKSILVTSTLPSEGKSFVASNLAASFVAHGKRVLLIDADMRRPSQHRSHNLDNSAGLMRWLDEGADLSGDLEKNQHLGLVEIAPKHFLLRTGGNTRRTSELIGSGRLNEVIKALQRRFDVVIFDTPPAGVFSDAVSFAEFCQECIFVCRSGKVSRQQVRSVLDRLRQTGLDFPGVVLNALPVGRGSGYYYYHGYDSSRRYAKYYSEEKTGA